MVKSASIGLPVQTQTWGTHTDLSSVIPVKPSPHTDRGTGIQMAGGVRHTVGKRYPGDDKAGMTKGGSSSDLHRNLAIKAKNCSVERHVALQPRHFFFVDVLADLFAELFDVAVATVLKVKWSEEKKFQTKKFYV